MLCCRQVDAFKEKLVSEAESAAEAAAAASLAKQEAVAAAKAPTDASELAGRRTCRPPCDCLTTVLGRYTAVVGTRSGPKQT